MNYAQAYFCDNANGIGLRTSLFVSGCTHHCKDCFNEIAWDFDYGEPFTDAIEDRIVDSLKPSYIAGLTILGGEPMDAVNQSAVRHLVERVKAEIPHSSTWIYSGYTFEELTDPNNKRCFTEHTMPILRNIDVLVDGRFVAELKDISLRFRGSSNQRIIDMPTTLAGGSVVLSPYGEKQKIQY